MFYNWLATLVLSIILTLQFSVAGALENLKITEPQNSGVPILCYHDVRSSAKDIKDNIWTVTEKNLRKHFNFLKNKGYTPISYDDYVLMMNGEKQIPKNPVLLTFDDGYESFYTKVYPILKEYNYPAILSIITSYFEHTPSDYAPSVTWSMLREMEESGLITIASHSHSSHKFLQATPQGDAIHALTCLQYNPNLNRYETFAEYRDRILLDLKKSQEIFEKELGHKAKVMVWPFGAFTEVALEAGKEVGFETFFELEGGFNTPGQMSIFKAKREIIINNPSTGDLEKLINPSMAAPVVPLNAATFSIDFIYDPLSPANTEENLRNIIERLLDCEVNTIFLQAFRDSNYAAEIKYIDSTLGTRAPYLVKTPAPNTNVALTEGAIFDSDSPAGIKEVYFYTNLAPVRVDILGHIASLLKDNGFNIYVQAPTIASKWLNKNQTGDSSGLIPFAPEDKENLFELFTNLAAYNNIDGILFQDDLYLDEAEYKYFSELNESEIIEFTSKLGSLVNRYNPSSKTIRSIGKGIIETPEPKESFLNNYEKYLNLYDYTIIKATPSMNRKSNFSNDWLKQLNLTKDKPTSEKLIFQYTTYNLESKQWLPPRQVETEIAFLRKQGLFNIFYYPDDIFSKWR